MLGLGPCQIFLISVTLMESDACPERRGYLGRSLLTPSPPETDLSLRKIGLFFTKIKPYLVSVTPDHAKLVLAALVFLLLFDAGDDPPAGAPGSDDVLVGHGEEVPLLHRQLHVERGHVLHGLHHF